MGTAQPGAWSRRARPLLGTLVEVGIAAAGEDAATIDAAFAALFEVQQCMSRFELGSDLSRFHALGYGQSLRVSPLTSDVLAAAAELQQASGGAFDISQGSAPQGWRYEGRTLHKLNRDVRLDLGGIAKGYAVDRAVQALMDRGCAAGWVNAGGDLRAFGELALPVHLRDEDRGGVRLFAQLQDGAFATSHFDVDTRSHLAAGPPASAGRKHVSVCAPRCLWADALTKIMAVRGDASDSLLARYGATAWVH